MKRYSLLAASLLALIFAFQGCKGPEGLPGPQGPEGPQGPPGAELLPVVFQVTSNFTAAGNYRTSYTFTNDFEVYDTDIVLVYLAYDVATVNGNETIIWRALPQVIPAGDGFFQYNYDYTQYDVEFFLDGNIDLATLDNSWTQNQMFRVAILPAEALARKTAVDLNNYEEVVKAYGIDESKIKTVAAK